MTSRLELHGDFGVLCTRILGWESDPTTHLLFREPRHFRAATGQAGRMADEEMSAWQLRRYPFDPSEFSSVTWLKIFEDGEVMVVRTNVSGSLDERRLHQPDERPWGGQWAVDDRSGAAIMRVGEYQLDCVGAVDGLHSGVEHGPHGSKFARLIRVKAPPKRFTDADIAGSRFLKLFANGGKYAVAPSAGGWLVEWALPDNRSTWDGRWEIGTGSLTVSVGDYRLTATIAPSGLHPFREQGPNGEQTGFLVQAQLGPNRQAAMDRFIEALPREDRSVAARLRQENT